MSGDADVISVSDGSSSASGDGVAGAKRKLRNEDADAATFKGTFADLMAHIDDEELADKAESEDDDKHWDDSDFMGRSAVATAVAQDIFAVARSRGGPPRVVLCAKKFIAASKNAVRTFESLADAVGFDLGAKRAREDSDEEESEEEASEEEEEESESEEEEEEPVA